MAPFAPNLPARSVAAPRIVVVGPGAMGSLLAACLMRARANVWLLDHNPTRAQGLARTGIRIDEPGLRWHIRLPVCTDVRHHDPADWVFFCVKAYDTPCAARHVRPVIRDHTTLVSFQNGIGNAERLATLLGRRLPLLCAATAHGATLIRPGYVRHAGRGWTLMAPWNPAAHQRVRAALRLLRAAGWPARAVSDARSLLWSKLVVNAAINPVTAIAGVRNGALLDRADLNAIAFQAAREAQQVARALKVRLLFPDAAQHVRRVCSRTRDNLSSMLQDVRLGRRTEIEAINGVVVAYARRMGIPVPVNRWLLKTVRALGRSGGAVRQVGKTPCRATAVSTPPRRHLPRALRQSVQLIWTSKAVEANSKDAFRPKTRAAPNR